MHLAQLNIAKPLHDLEHEAMAGFTNNLDKVNALAERSPGFIWRLISENNNATDLRFDGHDDLIINISVWRDMESLKHFAFNTVHRQLMQKGGQWFKPLGKAAVVLWHVREGHFPDLNEAQAKLNHIREFGPSADAFGWEGPDG